MFYSVLRSEFQVFSFVYLFRFCADSFVFPWANGTLSKWIRQNGLVSLVDLGAFELGLSKWRAWARAEMDTTAKWVRVSMPIGTLGRQSADVRAPSFLCEGTDIFVESFCHIMDMSLMAPPKPFFWLRVHVPLLRFLMVLPPKWYFYISWHFFKSFV